LVDIIVEEVAKNRDQVSLRALNVRFVFTRRDGFIRLVSKSKPEAQVYDPAACWVPKGVFLAVCRKAGAILTR